MRSHTEPLLAYNTFEDYQSAGRLSDEQRMHAARLLIADIENKDSPRGNKIGDDVGGLPQESLRDILSQLQRGGDYAFLRSPGYCCGLFGGPGAAHDAVIEALQKKALALFLKRHGKEDGSYQEATIERGSAARGRNLAQGAIAALRRLASDAIDGVVALTPYDTLMNMKPIMEAKTTRYTPSYLAAIQKVVTQNPNWKTGYEARQQSDLGSAMAQVAILGDRQRF